MSLLVVIKLCWMCTGHVHSFTLRSGMALEIYDLKYNITQHICINISSTSKNMGIRRYLNQLLLILYRIWKVRKHKRYHYGTQSATFNICKTSAGKRVERDNDILLLIQQSHYFCIHDVNTMFIWFDMFENGTITKTYHTCDFWSLISLFLSDSFAIVVGRSKNIFKYLVLIGWSSGNFSSSTFLIPEMKRAKQISNVPTSPYTFGICWRWKDRKIHFVRYKVTQKYKCVLL